MTAPRLLATLMLLLPVAGVRLINGVDVLNGKRNRRGRRVRPDRPHPPGLRVRRSNATSRFYKEEDVQELYFPQRLDHFSPTDARTFRQRYFYSGALAADRRREEDRNATTKPALALLCVGGEGPPLDRRVLVDSVHCSGDLLEFAKTVRDNYSVHLFALEHRYYGASLPSFSWYDPPLATRNLRFLSSRQAVQDIGHFIAAQNLELPDAVTWIAFGGSYPGVLAAWARLQLPHLVAMAVSSSAPVQVVLDFAAYNGHVARDFANLRIGGSPACLDMMHQGYVQLEAAVTAADTNSSLRREIAAAFRLCDANALRERRNLELLLGERMYPFIVQENDPACDGALCDIRRVCTALAFQVENVFNASETKYLDALAWMARQHRSGDDDDDDDEDCTSIDFQELLDQCADPVGPYSRDIRPWLWQTCTEMGFYQTCEANSSCPFGRGWHPLRQDLEICEAAFGIPPAQVADNVRRTLEQYGGWDLRATRVLSVTGAVDPWSEMALQKTRSSRDLPVYRVPKASHHFWTHPVKPTDAKEIQVAREIIFTTLRGWLAEPPIRQASTIQDPFLTVSR